MSADVIEKLEFAHVQHNGNSMLRDATELRSAHRAEFLLQVFSPNGHVGTSFFDCLMSELSSPNNLFFSSGNGQAVNIKSFQPECRGLESQLLVNFPNDSSLLALAIFRETTKSKKNKMDGNTIACFSSLVHFLSSIRVRRLVQSDSNQNTAVQEHDWNWLAGSRQHSCAFFPGDATVDSSHAFLPHKVWILT